MEYGVEWSLRAYARMRGADGHFREIPVDSGMQDVHQRACNNPKQAGGTSRYAFIGSVPLVENTSGGGWSFDS